MKFLAVASQPSDYVEMVDLAKGLVGRGHDVKLLYFYSESARAANAHALGEIAGMQVSRAGLSAEALDVDSVGAGTYAEEQSPTDPRADEPLAKEVRWTLVERTRNGLLRVAAWGRRKGVQSSLAGGRLDQAVPLTMVERASKGLVRVAVFGRRMGVLDRIPVRIRRFISTYLVFSFASLIDRLRSYRTIVKLLRANVKSLSTLSTIVANSYRTAALWDIARQVLAPGAVAEVAHQAVILRFYTAFLRYFLQHIRQESYDAILIPEDVVGYLWPSLIKAGHEQGIPTLVFPYTLANREEPLQSLRDEPLFQTRNNRFAALCHPRWRLQARGADLIRLPSAHVFAHASLHIAPPDPWMMNSGYANMICVDSRASYDYFRAGGIPASKMKIVGSVSQDRMYELKRDRRTHVAALSRELALEGDKPLLLLSGCPNQLSGKVPRCEFSDFGAIAAFIGETLRPLSEHYHLVVRPHPNFPEFGPMLAPYGFRSTMVPTSRLVPMSDLFIAFASATIRWSIASAVPTVNYDIFGYGYGDFSSATGVRAVDSSEQFAQAVRELLPDTARYRECASRIAADSAHWSVMDGGCLDRIENTIRRECARRPAPRTAN